MMVDWCVRRLSVYSALLYRPRLVDSFGVDRNVTVCCMLSETEDEM